MSMNLIEMPETKVSVIVKRMKSSWVIMLAGLLAFQAAAADCWKKAQFPGADTACECTGEIVPDCGSGTKLEPFSICDDGWPDGNLWCNSTNVSPGTLWDCERNWNNVKIASCLVILAAAVPVCAAACTAIVPCLACVATAGGALGTSCVGCSLVEYCEKVNERDIYPQPIFIEQGGYCPES